MPKKRVSRGGEIQNGGKVRGGKSICRRLSHARVSYYFFRPKLDEIHFATLFSPRIRKEDDEGGGFEDKENRCGGIVMRRQSSRGEDRVMKLRPRSLPKTNSKNVLHCQHVPYCVPQLIILW